MGINRRGFFFSGKVGVNIPVIRLAFSVLLSLLMFLLLDLDFTFLENIIYPDTFTVSLSINYKHVNVTMTHFSTRHVLFLGRASRRHSPVASL